MSAEPTSTSEPTSEPSSEPSSRPELIPIACTLPAERLPDQLAEWASLRSVATGTEPIEGGLRLTLPADRHDDARDLAAREQDCCSFLRLDVRAVGDRCVIDVTSDHPDAAPVIALIARGATDEHR